MPLADQRDPLVHLLGGRAGERWSAGLAAQLGVNMAVRHAFCVGVLADQRIQHLALRGQRPVQANLRRHALATIPARLPGGMPPLPIAEHVGDLVWLQ